jgi:hypothetical protein
MAPSSATDRDIKVKGHDTCGTIKHCSERTSTERHDHRDLRFSLITVTVLMTDTYYSQVTPLLSKGLSSPPHAPPLQREGAGKKE